MSDEARLRFAVRARPTAPSTSRGKTKQTMQQVPGPQKTRSRLARVARAALACWLLAALPGAAAASAPGPRGETTLGRSGARVSAELLVDDAVVAPGQTARVGVLFELEPGWHIYWKNPGDSGAATRLDWGAKQRDVGPIQWPAPRVFREAEGLLTTYGYEDEVLLASDAVVSPAAAGTWPLTVEADFVACLVECIPGRIVLAREVPVGERSTPATDAVRERFELAASRRPAEANVLGVMVAARASQSAAAAGDDLLLAIDVLSCSEAGEDCHPFTLDASDTSEAFLPAVVSDLGLKALGLSHAPTAATARARGFSLVLSAHAFESQPRLVGERLQGVIPLAHADGKTHLRVDLPIELAADGADAPAFEVVAALPAPTSQVKDTTEAGPRRTGSTSLGLALLLGLLGGLILNLMPCVLPVLAIKIFAITDLAQAERGHVVRHGLAYLAGVLTSMAALAAVVVALRAAGAAVGWGFQLQNPIFLALICTLLVVFALNLFGAFEITLQPSGPDLGAAGPASPARSFFEGSLAVALATPCTAPFLGTAVGFAFAASAGVIFAVFLAIGLGLAAPFVLVTLAPGWARFVPRPGPWMLRVRTLLGFCLLATVTWLVWVAGRAVGVDAQALLLAHLLAVAMLAWTFGVLQASAKLTASRWVAAAGLAFIVASLAGLPLAPAPVAASRAVAISTGGIEWQPFARAAIDRARAAGRPVFVDFTADWCITCKVNKTVVISTDAVREELERWNYATFQADWTRRDDEITRELAKFGRAGVPMYLVYPADAERDVEILPELLTLDATVDALRLAGRGAGV